MKQVRHFSSGSEAAAFATRVGVAADWTVNGWTVTWDDGEPEPSSSFDRIVSRNGGEDAPAEIVQRHRVTGITESEDGPAPSDEAFTVSLRALSGPYGVHESRFFAMPKEQAQLFKVGEVIEVVLRPAPLA